MALITFNIQLQKDKGIMIPFMVYMINLGVIMKPSITFCICLTIYNLVPIIMTKIKIAREDILILGGWYSLWCSLSKPLNDRSRLITIFYFVSFIIVIPFDIFIGSRFNFLLWKLGLFTFNLLTNAKTDTILVKWQYLVT